MKKWKILLAMLIAAWIVSIDCSVVEAAENEIAVVQAGGSVELLTEEEMAVISEQIMNDDAQVIAANASYTAYRYTDAFDYYFRGDWIARADVECIVWHYTDGKVHLYQRTIQLTKLISIGGARIYGSIVNTDGSYSYTTGDRVHIYLDEGTLSFAIDFYVSDTTAYFSCYEV